MQKFIHNYLPTNSRLHLLDNHHPDKCPCCHHQRETENNVLQCKSDTRTLLREKWLTKLNNFLNRPHTSNELWQCIIANTTTWLKRRATTQPHPRLCKSQIIDSAKVRSLNHHQTSIWWNHYIRGRISLSWRDEINHHLWLNQITHIKADQWVADLISIN
jgi:hypothetical protein